MKRSLFTAKPIKAFFGRKNIEKYSYYFKNP